MAKRNDQNLAMIRRYEIRHFDPLMLPERFFELADSPQVFPALARETADYLAFRHDPRMALLLGLALAKPDPALADQQRIVLVNRARESNSGSPALLATLGLLYHRQNDSDEGRRMLVEALQLDPSLEFARLNLAYLDFDLGKYEQAAEEFQSLLSADPENAEALYGLAFAQVRLGGTPLQERL